MKLPKIKVEKELLKKGKRLVVGIDEAGRGHWLARWWQLLFGLNLSFFGKRFSKK